MRDLRKKLKQASVDVMEINGYKAKIMKAKRLKSISDEEHSLPPGTPLKAVPVSCLPGAPEDWIKADGSYVIEVDSEMGLWFDWRDNNLYNTAIVPSVKGMNPITGQKIDSLELSKFKGRCPVHNCEFLPEKLCEECGYKWPSQNFISSPNTLWWDGFRQPDGSVRQFFFTEEDNRDVATHVMGKKNTVPAFGFAFYKTKKDRAPSFSSLSRGIDLGSVVWTTNDTTNVYEAYDNCTYTISNSSNSTLTSGSSTVFTCSDEKRKSLKSLPKNDNFLRSNSEERRHKDVSVGAGAKIRQELSEDVDDLDVWKEKPEGLIRLYFVFKEKMDDILNSGGVEFPNGDPEGYLSDIPVG